jgi:hypothetical protein
MEDCPFQLTKSEPACLPIKGDMAAFAGGQPASPRSILLGDAVRIFGYTAPKKSAEALGSRLGRSWTRIATMGGTHMPRSRQPRHLYGVFVFAHTSAAKEDFTVRMLYLDTGERQALLTFARATIEAAKDPLVYAVTLEKDLQTVVRVKVEHPNLP